MLSLRGIPLLLLALVIAAGCADQRAATEAPHPEDWVLTHGPQAQKDLNGCAPCHGSDYRGGGDVVGCFSCHVEGPPFAIHPRAWVKAADDHQRFAETLSWTACATAACHGTNLFGGSGSGETGPSCFANLADCHVSGPPAPHPFPYIEPSSHGPEARDRQAYCQNCHGRPPRDFGGGFVGDPKILGSARARCSQSACHPAAKAHPTGWQGEDDAPDPANYSSNHRSVRPSGIDTGCALCHNTKGPGAGPEPGAPSCFAATFANSAGASTGCHPQGPGVAPHAVPYADPRLHGPAAKQDIGSCQSCHGTVGTTRYDGGVAVACSSAGCHPAAGAHPTRWQGTDDSDPSFAATHRTVLGDPAISGCKICHAVTSGSASANPKAPSCFASGFENADGVATGCHYRGPGALPFHPPAWGNDHVFVARVTVSSCLAECHKDSTGLDGVIPGCAYCHLGGATTASRIIHPDGNPIPVDFGRLQGEAVGPHQQFVSETLAGDATSCALSSCHGTDLKGGAAPVNRSWGDGQSCFLSYCHSNPPLVRP